MEKDIIEQNLSHITLDIINIIFSYAKNHGKIEIIESILHKKLNHGSQIFRICENEKKLYMGIYAFNKVDNNCIIIYDIERKLWSYKEVDYDITATNHLKNFIYYSNDDWITNYSNMRKKDKISDFIFYDNKMYYSTYYTKYLYVDDFKKTELFYDSISDFSFYIYDEELFVKWEGFCPNIIIDVIDMKTKKLKRRNTFNNIIFNCVVMIVDDFNIYTHGFETFHCIDKYKLLENYNVNLAKEYPKDTIFSGFYVNEIIYIMTNNRLIILSQS